MFVCVCFLLLTFSGLVSRQHMRRLNDGISDSAGSGQSEEESEPHSVVVQYAGVTQAWAHMIMSLLKHANGKRTFCFFLTHFLLIENILNLHTFMV